MTDYKLYGYTMSPYSMKLRSYFRYRRIPFQWVSNSRANEIAMTKVKTYMVPVVENPDGVFKNDSTFIIDALETRFSDRGSEPENEADSFLAYLIEDYADEWLLMPFFMLRWRHEADRRFNSRWMLYEYLSGETTGQTFEEMAQGWSDRQVNLVAQFCGSEDMFTILDDSLDELLAVTERAFTNGLFLFGSRPSRAEFALYGVLSQLILDHTPSSYLRENFNYTYRWVTVMEDLSGSEGSWEPVSSDPTRLRASPITDLLKLSGKYHLPLLRANAEAMDAGSDMLHFEIDGNQFVRHVSKRHRHCLPTLQERYANLSSSAKEQLDGILRDTGCLAFLLRD